MESESAKTTGGKRLKVLELFAGTRSIGKAFEVHGHEVYSVEWDKKFDNIALYADIGTLTAEQCVELCGGVPDIIWASPDCSSYSVAAIKHHRKKDPKTGELIPQTDYARFCDKVNSHLVDLIDELTKMGAMYWFIENPVGGMRKMSFMQGLPRFTVTYCRYGDSRMKPTDLFTNHPNPDFKPPCHYGDSCHIRAPRGSKLGTQGLNGSMERARIPEQLCMHIVDICEHPDQSSRLRMNPQASLAEFDKDSVRA